ncbi:MAG: signal peptidase II [bacterium]|nr:signal peptidase II [bacterium]
MKKYIFLAFLFVLLDQITKFFFQYKNIEILSFFSFRYAENTGVAFSLFQGYNFLFVLVSLLALGGIFYYFRSYPLALSFLCAGVLGNLLDRIFFGFVRDFISVSIWPIFNLADTWNSIGVLLLLYAFWKEEKINKAHSSKNR